jgi:signal transduction histidine kinase
MSSAISETPATPRPLRLTLPLKVNANQAPLASGFFVLLLIAVASLWLASVNRDQSRMVAHTLEVQSKASQVLNLVEDAETGQRGYLLTHKLVYLEPYLEGAAKSSGAVDDLARLTLDNPRQRATLAELKSLVDAKVAELARTVVKARAGDFAGALAIVQTGRGRDLMQGVREKVAEVQVEEARLLRVRQASTASTGAFLLVLSLGGVLLVILLAVVSIRIFQRSTRLLEESEARLKAANDGLETLVAQRTAELTESNEEIQRYAYIVSHDLRAPLVNVMGFTSELDEVRDQVAERLRDDPSASPLIQEFDEALNYIKAAITKMEGLIGAILKISREGRRAFLPEALDMRALVKGLADAQHHQTQAVGAEVAVGELPAITADRLAVEQIFANLVDNALKYLDPARPGRVEVAGTEVGGLVRFEVRDNGRGIAPGDFARVFELFRRSGPQDRPGEGIGLAHVKALVRSLGGRIELASVLGEGTTFTVWLPSKPPARAGRPTAE